MLKSGSCAFIVHEMWEGCVCAHLLPLDNREAVVVGKDNGLALFGGHGYICWRRIGTVLEHHRSKQFPDRRTSRSSLNDTREAAMAVPKFTGLKGGKKIAVRSPKGALGSFKRRLYSALQL